MLYKYMNIKSTRMIKITGYSSFFHNYDFVNFNQKEDLRLI